MTVKIVSALRFTKTTANDPFRDAKRRRMSELFWDVSLILLVALLLAAPAIWNGYPLIYHDTEDYVTMSFTWDPPPWRIIGYSVVAWLGRPFGTLWSVVVLQSLIGSWLLHEVAAAFLPHWRRWGFLVLSLSLVATTGLPWMASELMPDVFAGFVPLIIGILAFGNRLSLVRRLVLAAVGVLAILVHMSHVAVAAGLLIVLAVMWVGARYIRSLPRPALGLVTLTVVLGTLAVPAIHAAATGKPFFSRGGRVLQLALFVQNGIAKTYLDTVCPRGAHYKLCQYRDQLPSTADAFLWAHWASPFWKLGGWTGMQQEAEQIVDGAIQEYPEEVVKDAAANTWEQYWEIELGDGLAPKRHPHWPGEYYDVGKARYPHEFQDYLAARQQRGGGIDFRPLNDMQVPLAEAGRLLAMVLTLLAFRRRDRIGVGLGLVVLLALLGNAVVCGAISNPHERYQNRVVWDALAVALILVARKRDSREYGVGITGDRVAETV